MRQKILSLFIATLFSSTLAITADACTDFKMSANDGTVLITRSMEFASDLHSNLRTASRGKAYATTTPNNKPGLSWKAKYGYLYLDGFGIDAAFDGMNEAGLTFEYLYLPSETTYQTIPTGKDNQAIPYDLFGNWILSNFKTIDEVKQALSTIYVSTHIIPELGNVVLPAHAAIHDASGKSIVVEFYNDKINVYDYIGIMTNAPKYDWHVANLRNYLNLSPNNPNPIAVNGMNFSATGQGAGMIGLPGDFSPPSRFVKMAFMVKNAYTATKAADLLNIGEHIINNVDIPAGVSRSVDNGKTATDVTQWVVFKDMTHKIFYYRTYNNMTLRQIDMNKIDFSENAPSLKMPVMGSPYVMDATTQFQATK